mgnify:FL=1
MSGHRLGGKLCRDLWMRLGLTALISIAAMVMGAALGNQGLAVLAGALFAGVTAFVGWRFAMSDLATLDGNLLAARYARLIAVAWAWCGIAMLACYYLTALSWQHAWQYGAGMLLIAVLVRRYAEARATPGSPFASASMVSAARWATQLQGLAALIGVVVLALSGKLDPAGRDWAANIVFVAGGLTLFTLSTAALRAERRQLGQ